MAELVARVRELVDGRTDLAEEGELLALLTGCGPTELCQVLAAVDPSDLFGSVDDRLIGPDLRTELIHLLAVQRRHELDLPARAQVASGLQRMGTDPRHDEALAGLLTDLVGVELTRLKNLVNTNSSHDLEDLVYSGLASPEVRERLLTHIASGAEGLAIEEPKVLSDIDDTALCMLHDRRYRRGIVYPGVLALYQALDRGADDRPFDIGDLTFITARPRDALGLIEGQSRSVLRRAGVSRLALMSGTFSALRSKQAMAEHKLANVRRYRRIFPEYPLLFIGDSGQGDVVVGEGLYAEHGQVVRLVLIHDVVETPVEQREAYAARGLHFFDTYIGAALVAHRHELIGFEALAAVTAEAVAGFERLDWDSPGQRAAMCELFERDLADVESVLEPGDSANR